jgi:capsular polysaccharide biosynthesis protein
VQDAAVIGGWGVVFTRNGYALWDVARCDQADRFDLTSGSLPVVDRDEVQANFGSVADDDIPEGILLQSWFASSYHHWLIEHLPRLALIERMDIPATVPLLIDERALAVPQLVDALAAFDIAGHPVVGLAPGVRYDVRKLYVPSCLFGTGPNLKGSLVVETGDVTIHREAIRLLRERFAPVERPGTRRIYIDRTAKMAPVRLLNGQEVRAVFEEFGFETVSPGNMTFAEQRGTFGDASIIAGESGAAMTNIILAPESTRMLVMQAQRWPLNIYGDLATYGGQQNMFIAGTEKYDPHMAQQTYQRPFEINTAALRATLADIL